jgi:uncharacterized protein (DUF362 family)
MKRRSFLGTAGAGLGVLQAGCEVKAVKEYPDLAGRTAVAILKAKSYSENLFDLLKRGAALSGLEARGKRVLLKPNLVEFDSTTAINTHVAMIQAAVELFRDLGAADVAIGEGPGHRRDTIFLAEEAGYRKGVERFDGRFVDLNRDDVSAVVSFGQMGKIYFPNSVLSADLIVSLAKMKTHHWAGATLSMKNYFGLVPGSIYGWPKNQLHRIGIPQSITELHRKFAAKSYAIVDGIVGMEGNGPIQGKPKKAGVVVMGADLVAVDATCCRIMGIDPEKIDYLKITRSRGHLPAAAIEQRGERIADVKTPFELIDTFGHLRA